MRVARQANHSCVWASISVRDSGIGIAPDELAHVFDRFYCGSNVGGIAGSGIGLSGARQIVEQHGATLKW